MSLHSGTDRDIDFQMEQSMASGSGILINSTSLLANTTDGPVINPELVLSRLAPTIQLVLCLLVLRVFYRLPSIRTKINFPVFNLVAADILRAILGFASTSFHFTNNHPSTYARVFCVVFRYLNNVQIAWSAWAITIVAYSRYDNVANVFSPKFTLKRFWTLTVTSWIVSLLTSLPPIIGWSSYGIRANRCATGSMEKNLGSVTFLPLFYFVNYLVPSILVIVLFSCIVCIISSRRQRNDTSLSNSSNVIVPAGFKQSSLVSGEQDRVQTAATDVKKIILSKSFLYISIIVVTNVLLLAPYVVTTSYDTVSIGLGRPKKIPLLILDITTVLFMVNYGANCLLYIFWIKTFQQTTGALCCRKQRRSAAPV